MKYAAVLAITEPCSQLIWTAMKQKLKSLARLDQPNAALARFWPSTAKRIGSPGEVLSDQPIRWCCIDRFSWQIL